jgi:Sodium Bile acid symporter family
VLFRLSPILAVGMMLLAASPGGTTANLYSHLFRGDVALNISLTAVNSVIAVFTLPLITNAAIGWFDPFDDQLGMQFGKTLEVFAIVLVPVVLGMLVRRSAPAFARRMDRPVRIVSIVVLVAVIIGAVLSNGELLVDNVASLVRRAHPRPVGFDRGDQCDHRCGSMTITGPGGGVERYCSYLTISASIATTPAGSSASTTRARPSSRTHQSSDQSSA